MHLNPYERDNIVNLSPFFFLENALVVSDPTQYQGVPNNQILCYLIYYY